MNRRGFFACLVGLVVAGKLPKEKPAYKWNIEWPTITYGEYRAAYAAGTIRYPVYRPAFATRRSRDVARRLNLDVCLR